MDFFGLSDLPHIFDYLIKYTKQKHGIDCNTFASTLKLIHENPNDDVTLFVLPELPGALRKTRNRRGADKANVVVEMIKFGGLALHEKLLECYNQILLTGTVPENWHLTIFTMLPKSGDLENVSNWRPIAILPISYKVFSKMVYYHFAPI